MHLSAVHPRAGLRAQHRRTPALSPAKPCPAPARSCSCLLPTYRAAVPDGYVICPTTPEHVQQLASVEQLCSRWSAGWSASDIQAELERPFAVALSLVKHLPPLQQAQDQQQTQPQLPQQKQKQEEQQQEGQAAAVGYAVAWLIADELQVLEVAVHPDHQGRGLGRALLQQLLDTTRPRWSKAVLEVKASNQVALGLYGGLGFQQVGRRKGYYPDGSDALLLELAAH